ncbi:MAG: hypothetical protein ACRC62_23810 [Microcoleus sp.]
MSIVNCQLRGRALLAPPLPVNCQLSTLNCQLSTLNYQLLNVCQNYF